MIFFVRHGESEANLQGVFAGQRNDSILTSKGREQARATALKIKKEGIVINTIISSPLKRSKETAEIIAVELGIDLSAIQIDTRITEYDMGSLTSTPVKDISSTALAAAPGAENPELFKQRVLDCLRGLLPLKGNILLVSHAGVGRILETVKLDKESKYFYDLPAWGNASVTKIDWIV